MVPDVSDQLHRPPGGLHAGRVHRRRAAYRNADRGPQVRRRGGARRERRLRAGQALARLIRRTGLDERWRRSGKGRVAMETRRPARERETQDRRREGIVSGVEGFNERGRRAIGDQQLHDAVATASRAFVTNRNAVLNALPEAPELRERAYRIKQQTMANLDRYLEQMADAVESRGGEVF